MLDGNALEIALTTMLGNIGYQLMLWTHNYMWPVVTVSLLILGTIGFTPLAYTTEDNFLKIVAVWVRRALLYLLGALIANIFIMFYLYDSATGGNPSETFKVYSQWLVSISETNSLIALAAICAGFFIQFVFKRYALPLYSGMLRKLRFTQVDDKVSDIRDESGRFKAKDFLPSKHYQDGKVLFGINDSNKPIFVPASTWYETNVQVIGPTRYGKGVILGCLMDQSIRRGDTVFYIDPKRDRFAPHIMYQAALAAGRPFYYLTLHDDGIGKWAPFAGGSVRDGFSRLEMAFGLELTGDPGTDYYKGQELKDLNRAFSKSRSIEGLANLMEDTEANRTKAELARWAEVKSLCPKKGTGFSIENALREGAVVYVQGSLDDAVVKSATKVFISELIQEARRLDAERQTHLTAYIDEVSFLASKILAQSLATAVGFRVNFVLAYQSQDDLLNLDDKSVNARYVHHSINVNSQIKAVYGGADYETAEWAANLSGTVTKEITRLEQTEISAVGGESWNHQRAVGIESENHISTNVVLTLPPRVCVFVQPGQLMQVCFSSFVPVADTALLPSYIASKSKKPDPSVLPSDDEEIQPPAISATDAEAFTQDANAPSASAQPLEPEQKKSAAAMAAQALQESSAPAEIPAAALPVIQKTGSEEVPDAIIEARRARRKRQAEKKKASAADIAVEPKPDSDQVAAPSLPAASTVPAIAVAAAAVSQLAEGGPVTTLVNEPADLDPFAGAATDAADFEFAPVKADSDLLALLSADDDQET